MKEKYIKIVPLYSRNKNKKLSTVIDNKVFNQLIKCQVFVKYFQNIWYKYVYNAEFFLTNKIYILYNKTKYVYKTINNFF